MVDWRRTLCFLQPRLCFEQSVAGRLFSRPRWVLPGVVLWVLWAVLAFLGCGVVCCDASFLRAFGRPESRVDALGRRGGHQVIAVSRHLCFFTGCAFDRRDVAGCRRAPVGRVKRANGLLALLRQPRRERRAPRWPRTPEKAKLSEPHGARRARSFRAHRRRALFHLRARGPRGAPKLLKNGRS